jgi:PAS domain S-box-containing protein
MRIAAIKDLLDSTADPAFVVDAAGIIIAANAPAATLFGVLPGQALGLRCWELARGADERGPFCSEQCAVRQAVHRGRSIGNFDLQLHTKNGPRWYNVSILAVRESSASNPCAVHILRDVDTRRRLETLVREFVITSTGLPQEEAAKLLATSRAPARLADLTRQEVEVLRLLAKGCATKGIAQRLHISTSTVNNHIQHILGKLDVHTRLEAIRRAESAGLI